MIGPEFKLHIYETNSESMSIFRLAGSPYFPDSQGALRHGKPVRTTHNTTEAKNVKITALTI